MELSRRAKLFVGALTLWPILYIFLFIAFAVGMMFYASGVDAATRAQEPPAALFVVVALHFATIAMFFALIAFYIVYSFKTDRVPQDKKALWAAVLFFCGMVAMPVFFYLYIWPEAGPDQKP